MIFCKIIFSFKQIKLLATLCGNIQSEFLRFKSRTYTFRICDDGGSKTRTDLAGFLECFIVGQTDRNSRKERIPCTGCIYDRCFCGGI